MVDIIIIMQVVMSARRLLPLKVNQGLHQLPATNENLKKNTIFKNFV